MTTKLKTHVLEIQNETRSIYIAILNYECIIASITNLLVKVNNHNSAVWVLCLASKHAHQPACICAVG